MAVWAIGDVQGCLEPLDALLDRIEFDRECDRLWFCGDLVNRGPDSEGVLERVRELGDAAVVVLGNHDLHWLAQQANEEDAEIQAHAEWLRTRPLAHFDANLNCLLVHAGVLPRWDLKQTLERASEVEGALKDKRYRDFLAEMYGNAPNVWKDELSGVRRLRMIVNAFTRMRMVDEQNRLDFSWKGPPGEQPPYLAPWFARPASLPHGCRVVFGHWSGLGCFITDRFIALDSGCVWGRSLTAVRLDGPPQSASTPCPLGAAGERSRGDGQEADQGRLSASRR